MYFWEGAQGLSCKDFVLACVEGLQCGGFQQLCSSLRGLVFLRMRGDFPQTLMVIWIGRIGGRCFFRKRDKNIGMLISCYHPPKDTLPCKYRSSRQASVSSSRKKLFYCLLEEILPPVVMMITVAWITLSAESGL